MYIIGFAMKKRFWQFRCKNGKGGTMILLDPVDMMRRLQNAGFH